MQHAYSGVQVRRTQYAYAYAHTTSQIKLEDARNKFTPRPLQCRCCPGCGAVSAFCIAHTRFPARAPRARTRTGTILFLCFASAHAHTLKLAHTQSIKHSQQPQAQRTCSTCQHVQPAATAHTQQQWNGYLPAQCSGSALPTTMALVWHAWQ